MPQQCSRTQSRSPAHALQPRICTLLVRHVRLRLMCPEFFFSFFPPWLCAAASSSATPAPVRPQDAPPPPPRPPSGPHSDSSSTSPPPNPVNSCQSLRLSAFSKACRLQKYSGAFDATCRSACASSCCRAHPSTSSHDAWGMYGRVWQRRIQLSAVGNQLRRCQLALIYGIPCLNCCRNMLQLGFL